MHVVSWGNIFPHVRFQLLVCTSFPTCTVPVCIFELSVPLFPHVQFHPNMHYPFLAHVRSKLHLINNNFIKINDQKIFSRLIMVRLGTLIQFAKFSAKILLMAKLLQNYSNLNDLEYSRHLKARKVEKRPKFFLKAKQRPEVEKPKFS